MAGPEAKVEERPAVTVVAPEVAATREEAQMDFGVVMVVLPERALVWQGVEREQEIQVAGMGKVAESEAVQTVVEELVAAARVEEATVVVATAAAKAAAGKAEVAMEALLAGRGARCTLEADFRLPQTGSCGPLMRSTPH